KEGKVKAPRSVLAAVVLALACGRQESPAPAGDRAQAAPDAQGHTAPSPFTVATNAAVAKELPLDDQHDFEDVRRGLGASEADVVVTGVEGGPSGTTGAEPFVPGEAPTSVNPSLWRQAKLNGVHGLFEVVPGIHQVRGYDISNMTIIDGKTGSIVVDPLASGETAARAFALARRALGEKPVVAVIFTHSHVDHFGGIEGVLPDEASRAAVRVVAPRGFIEEATSENVLAGLAMGRRATFMYGVPLARGARGHVDTGLGKEPSVGHISI